MSTLRFFSILVLVLVVLDATNGQGLKLGFYKKTCPDEESIVRKTTGCDGSVLINSTGSNQAEKSAPPNLSLRGFGVIDAVKAAVEQKCLGVVSCADILFLAATDAVATVEDTDGYRLSTATNALTNLPPGSADISTLKATFASKGLSSIDLAVLSGAHTIGVSFCSSFTQRLYNFTGKGDSDPTLDSEYVPRLKSKCKPNDAFQTAEMDPGSFKTFDSSYYWLVIKRRGLFQSDSALLNESVTKAYVKNQATRKRSPTFLQEFAKSMEKMNAIEVLTDNAGEIRKHCAFIN
ncbi:hypothetical protein MKX01_030707 [Papaver californicum]|nr:hypothetical protein MKX01_030707 [Papaver californicum]